MYVYPLTNQHHDVSHGNTWRKWLICVAQATCIHGHSPKSSTSAGELQCRELSCWTWSLSCCHLCKGLVQNDLGTLLGAPLCYSEIPWHVVRTVTLGPHKHLELCQIYQEIGFVPMATWLRKMRSSFYMVANIIQSGSIIIASGNI